MEFSESHTFDMLHEHETGGAYKLKSLDTGKTDWYPKSQVIVTDSGVIKHGKLLVSVTMKEWLAKEKGLI